MGEQFPQDTRNEEEKSEDAGSEDYTDLEDEEEEEEGEGEEEEYYRGTEECDEGFTSRDERQQDTLEDAKQQTVTISLDELQAPRSYTGQGPGYSPERYGTAYFPKCSRSMELYVEDI